MLANPSQSYTEDEFLLLQDKLRNYYLQEGYIDRNYEKSKFLMKNINVLEYMLELFQQFVQVKQNRTHLQEFLIIFSNEKFRNDAKGQEKSVKFLTILLYSLRLYKKQSKELSVVNFLLEYSESNSIQLIKLYLKLHKMIYQYVSRQRQPIIILDNIILKFDNWSSIVCRLYGSRLITEFGRMIREYNQQHKNSEKLMENTIDCPAFIKFCLDYFIENPGQCENLHLSRSVSPLPSKSHTRTHSNLNQSSDANQLYDSSTFNSTKSPSNFGYRGSQKDLSPNASGKIYANYSQNLIVLSASPTQSSSNLKMQKTYQTLQTYSNKSLKQPQLQQNQDRKTPTRSQAQYQTLASSKTSNQLGNKPKSRMNEEQFIPVKFQQEVKSPGSLNKNKLTPASNQRETSSQNSIAAKSVVKTGETKPCLEQFSQLDPNTIKMHELAQKYNILADYTKELQSLFTLYLNKTRARQPVTEGEIVILEKKINYSEILNNAFEYINQ